MDLTPGEKIRVLMKRKGLTLSALAERTGQTRQNLANKLSRDNFSVRELQEIARAIGCTLDVIFTDESGDSI